MILESHSEFMKTLNFALFFLLTLTAGCASQTTTTSEATIIDYRNTEGAFIIVNSTDQEFRTQFEDRLVADLAARDFKGIASYPEIPDVSTTNREEVLAAANAQKAMFVLVVEELKRDEAGAVPSDNPGRITRENETLKDFYETTRPTDGDYDEDDQVFVEVSGFLIQGDTARLIWSGTTWSFEANEQEDRIANLSATISQEIDIARRKRRLGL